MTTKYVRLLQTSVLALIAFSLPTSLRAKADECEPWDFPCVCKANCDNLKSLCTAQNGEVTEGCGWDSEKGCDDDITCKFPS